MEIRAKKLKEFLKLTNGFGTEPCLKIDKTGISTVVVDPAHVGIISAKLPVSEDCVTGGENYEFTVDGVKLLKYVSAFKASDTIKLEVVDDGGRITLSANGMRFKSSLLEASKWVKVPDLSNKLNAGGTFYTADLKAIIGSKLGSITFDSKDGNLISYAKSETDSIEVTGDAGSEEPAIASYSEEYILTALAGEQVEVRFGTDLPCLIVPQLENLEVNILIAPRIERD